MVLVLMFVTTAEPAAARRLSAAFLGVFKVVLELQGEYFELQNQRPSQRTPQEPFRMYESPGWS